MKFITLHSGTRLFHGTNAPTLFKMLKGPAWLTQSLEKAEEWVGWSESGGGGEPRVLEYTTTKALKLVDTTRRNQWEELGEKLLNDPEPVMWTIAKAVQKAGYDGWFGGSEILVSNPSKALHFTGKRVRRLGQGD